MSAHSAPRVAMLAALLVTASAATAQPQNSSQTTSRSADEGRVVGLLIDQADRAPVAGALVFLSDGRTTETDQQGRFSFLHVRPGQHEIAAVTEGCGLVRGGFAVQSGQDALLRLEVAVPSPREAPRSLGTAATVIQGKDLQEIADRSLFYAIERKVPFLVEDGRQGPQMRTTRGTTVSGSAEPLLVLDGTRVYEGVLQVLKGIKAGDVSRVVVHRGAAAGWEHGYGAENGVIEVTTRTVNDVSHDQSPEACVAGR